MRIALHRDNKQVVIRNLDDTDGPLVSLVIAIGVPIKLLQFEAANLLRNLKQAGLFPMRASVVTDVVFWDVGSYSEVAV
jgi:hypothetical protein